MAPKITTTPPDAATTRSREIVTPVDWTQPVYLTLRQTLTRNVLEVFQGENAQQLAMDSAEEAVKASGVVVGVFGPHWVTIYPPKDPARVFTQFNGAGALAGAPTPPYTHDEPMPHDDHDRAPAGREYINRPID